MPAIGPLSGIRVVDLATERGELAGRVLADLGAEVIKVEPPEGAASRRLPPFDGREGPAKGESLYWASVALGKKSVVLDVRTPAGADRLLDLAASADVFIESFEPGEAATLGFGPEVVRALNPRVIYVSISPYGQDGPDAHSPATDLTLEAAGGIVSLQGDGDRPPISIGYPQAFFHAGCQAATDAIIALNEREVSGLGQHLDTAAQPAMVWTLMNASGYPPNLGRNPPGTCETRPDGTPELMPGIKFQLVNECKDGHILTSMSVGALGSKVIACMIRWAAEEGQFPGELLAYDWHTWQAQIADGSLTAEQVMQAVRAIWAFFKTKTKAELLARAVHDDFMLAPFYTMAEVANDPQLAARDYWVEVDGRRHPGKFALMSGTPVVVAEPAPKLGEHQALLDAVPTRTAAPPVDHSVPRRGAFEGIKVADFAWVGVGPLIAKALADHGATVVHVESVTRPDVLRLGQPMKDGIAGIDRSQFQANFNSSKLGLALNLTMPEGNALAHRLVQWADVVVESFTPGTVNKVGLDWKTLSADRPDLVMLSTCLRGQTGPEATYAGFGTHGAVLAGFGVLTGWPDRAPKGPWGAYTDFIAPRYGVAALASAIYHRRKTGKGQYIDLSQVEAAIHFLEPLLLDYTVNGKVPGGTGHHNDRAFPHATYRCAGHERYVAIACETVEHWRALKAVCGLEQFRSAEYDDMTVRRRAGDAIHDVIAAWCCERDVFEVTATLKAGGVPASVVFYPTDLYEDPQLTHRGFFVPLEHGEMGLTPYDGLVTKFSDAPTGPHTAGPCLGQHTDHVLRDILGLDEDELLLAAAAGALS